MDGVVLVQSLCDQYTQHNTKVKTSVGPWQVQSLKSATMKSDMGWNVITMLVVITKQPKVKK